MGRPIAADMVIERVQAQKTWMLTHNNKHAIQMGFGPHQQKWNLHGHEPTTAWNSTDIELRFREILTARLGWVLTHKNTSGHLDGEVHSSSHTM